MNVFISWSGEISHKFALALKDWLPNVIQQLKPFVSSVDIDKGSIWFGDIGERLSNEYQFGILCLNPINYNEPWILFEAGALFKGLQGKSKVAPLLIGLKNTDVKPPLSQFNMTVAEKEDMKKLIKSINNYLGESKLVDKTIETTFDKFWPDLEPAIENAIADIGKAKGANVSSIANRTQGDMIEEILENTRNISIALKQRESLPAFTPYYTDVSSLGLRGYDVATKFVPVTSMVIGNRSIDFNLVGPQPTVDKSEDKDRKE